MCWLFIYSARLMVRPWEDLWITPGHRDQADLRARLPALTTTRPKGRDWMLANDTLHLAFPDVKTTQIREYAIGIAKHHARN
jgi:hypothetical protein